jgi:hypothetical protein
MLATATWLLPAWLRADAGVRPHDVCFMTGQLVRQQCVGLLCYFYCALMSNEPLA